MLLTSARITNFRSIEDSTTFTLDKDITCFVGKNESGKTSLLTALYRLNPAFESTFDKQRDYTRRFLTDYDERHGKDAALIVDTHWSLCGHESETIESLVGAEAAGTVRVRIWRRYGDEQPHWNVKVDEAKVVAHLLANSELADEVRDELAKLTTVKELRERAASREDEDSKQFATVLAAQFPADAVTGAIRKLCVFPRFVLFSQYQRLQGTVSLEQILQRVAAKTLTEDDQVFMALCELAGANPEKIRALTQFEEVVSRFEAASNKLSREIFTYWTQNRFLKVQFRVDSGLPGDPPPFNTGRVLRTRIHNEIHQVTVPFDDRSSGFVWFFSFLALFSQIRKQHQSNLILLLDEPALSLHARAQGDLLRYFWERLAPEYQVIYTTHSPFMVPPEKLTTVRLVEDVVVFKEGQLPEVHGTKVRDDVLVTDRDTLFPLQGALGYELTQTLFVGPNALLVEGPSDLLYFQVMSEELRRRGRVGLDRRWTVCPCGGADKIGAFVTLFGGNKLSVAAVLDYAQGQKKKVEDLRKIDVLKTGRVLSMETYAGQAEADTEDLFGAAVYTELVRATFGMASLSVPAGASVRVVKAIEGVFAALPPSTPEFDHYAPAAYLVNHVADLTTACGADWETALGRFESLFNDLNSLLPSK